MQDNELIASFGPKSMGWVLVMAFDSLEEALIEQERIQALHRQDRDDEGTPLPQVETLWLGEAQWGERELMAGQIRAGLLVASEAAIQETAAARRDWAATRMLQVSRLPHKRGTSQAWALSLDQADMFDRYIVEVLEADPAGRGMTSARIKTHVARKGFNLFCMDRDRPDLQLNGVPGGKAFSGALQAAFPDELAVLQDEAGNPYYHGLRRREGVNRKYFRLP